MSNVKQISVFVDNRPNQAAGAMRVIKESGVNLRALSLADTADFGIIRLIANDTEKAVKALKAASYAVNVTEVCAISIPDTPGQLSRVLDALGEDDVNVEYMYSFLGASDRSVSFVIRVDDNSKAGETFTKTVLFSLPKMI